MGRRTTLSLTPHPQSSSHPPPSMPAAALNLARRRSRQLGREGAAHAQGGGGLIPPFLLVPQGPGGALPLVAVHRVELPNHRFVAPPPLAGGGWSLAVGGHSTRVDGGVMVSFEMDDRKIRDAQASRGCKHSRTWNLKIFGSFRTWLYLPRKNVDWHSLYQYISNFRMRDQMCRSWLCSFPVKDMQQTILLHQQLMLSCLILALDCPAYKCFTN